MSHPTIWQPGLISLGNSGLCWTVFARNRDTAVPVEEMATYRHWSVSLWRDPDDVPHCQILSPDKTEWQLISAALCRWRCCFVADQLWFMTRIQEELMSHITTGTLCGHMSCCSNNKQCKAQHPHHGCCIKISDKIWTYGSCPVICSYFNILKLIIF